MTTMTLELGPVPREEAAARPGRTPAFDRVALLEAGVHRAALIARYGPPPLGATLRTEGRGSGQDCRYGPVARYDGTDPVACVWAAALAAGLARWGEAGFDAPVRYDDAGRVRELAYADQHEAARRVMVALERRRIDGIATAWEPSAAANLRRAYPRSAEDADQQLRQLATERAVRAPKERQVSLYAPYRLTFFPAAFNEFRGSDRLGGDVVDVEARERRGRRYVMIDLGSVRTPDEALDACWEHYARYPAR